MPQCNCHHQSAGGILRNPRNYAAISCVILCVCQSVILGGVIPFLVSILSGVIVIATFFCPVPRWLILASAIGGVVIIISNLFMAIFTEDLPGWHGECESDDPEDDDDFDYDLCVDLTRWFAVGTMIVWIPTMWLIYKIPPANDETTTGSSNPHQVANDSERKDLEDVGEGDNTDEEAAKE